MSDTVSVKNTTSSASYREGIRHVIIPALLWSIFSWWLAFHDHHPSGRSVFSNQYYIQSFLLTPVLLSSWIIFAGFLWRKRPDCARTKREDWFATTGKILGRGYLFFWVLPDIFVYGIWGFEHLRYITPFLPIATTVFVVVSTAKRAELRPQKGSNRSVLYALLAWILQAIPILVFIR
ncbi:MAG: hypothetical protein VX278_18995 [Myxococcota bacterium]|nr:hypothetical protein [Myxococcota bacterium]